jgi:hypothetical protein
MPAERVSMRRVREILRLKYEAGASDRAIARSVGVARSTARLCLDRVAAAGLVWPLSETLTDGALEALAVSMNFGPAVLTNSGPPSVFDRLARASRSASLFCPPGHAVPALCCAVVRRNR